MPGTGALPKDPAQRRRRNITPGFRQLPAEGRLGDPPDFPLRDALDEELDIWVDLWKLPQAVEWERLEYTRIVARYVRMLIDSEGRNAKLQLLSEIRQIEDRLGLTPRAMQTLRWETDEPRSEPKKNPSVHAVADPYVPRAKAE